jgi:hypothetical protein
MKTKIIILLFGILFSVLSAQNDSLIVLKQGKSIKVDGVLSNNEWRDADSLFIKIKDNWISTIYYKHDSSHILFAFKNLAQEAGKDCVVDLYFDLLNKKSNEWDSLDLWLHSSFSNCEARGKYFDWKSCTKTKPDWVANNLPFKNGNDNIEMQINTSKIFNKEHPDTLGFCFSIHHDDLKGYWPSNSDYTKPSTWGKITFSKDFISSLKNK